MDLFVGCKNCVAPAGVLTWGLIDIVCRFVANDRERRESRTAEGEIIPTTAEFLHVNGGCVAIAGVLTFCIFF